LQIKLIIQMTIYSDNSDRHEQVTLKR